MNIVIFIVIGVLIVILAAIDIVRYKKLKSIGKIIITDEDSLYVELNDYSSMDKIHSNKYVVFEVWHEKQISPK